MQTFLFSNKLSYVTFSLRLDNNEVVDIGCVKKMNFKELTGFDLEHNKIDIRTSNCFIERDKAYSDAKKKYPFILI